MAAVHSRTSESHFHVGSDFCKVWSRARSTGLIYKTLTVSQAWAVLIQTNVKWAKLQESILSDPEKLKNYREKFQDLLEASILAAYNQLRNLNKHPKMTYANLLKWVDKPLPYLMLCGKCSALDMQDGFVVADDESGSLDESIVQKALNDLKGYYIYKTIYEGLVRKAQKSSEDDEKELDTSE